jgi:multidrug efflux pump subunit AcrB
MDMPVNNLNQGWIAKLAKHRLAANLLMVLMLLAGIWAAVQIHVQLNPNRSWNQAQIQLIWPGASAEDMEILVTNPVEYQVKSIQGLEHLRSWTRNGATWINLNFSRDTDIDEAIDEIKQRLGQVRDLPPELEPPTVRVDRWYETVASIFITGPDSIEELTPFALEIQNDLRNMGIDVVELRGVPREELAIEIDGITLVDMNVSLADIARRIGSLSTDTPAGTIGIGQGERQIRSMERQRTVNGFEDMPIASMQGDQLVALGDIAHIDRRTQENQRLRMIDGKPAIEIRLRRGDTIDTFDAADIMKRWYATNEPKLAEQGIETKVFLEA